MLLNVLLVSSTLLTSVMCLPTGHVLHEKRQQARSLYPRQRVDSSAVIPIRIALKQSNLESGYERLLEVSHPSSSAYGQHLSAEEVHSIFAPATETAETVKNWLLSSGVEASRILPYSNKGWLSIDMPAEEAERLFHTEYYEHDDGDSGLQRMGCDAYYLPAHVSKHVDFIKPGVVLSSPLKKRVLKRDGSLSPSTSGRRFPYGRPPHARPNHQPNWHMPTPAYDLPPALQTCSVNITPTCIRALYDIPMLDFHSPENIMGLYEDYDAFSQQDIDLDFVNLSPWVPNGTAPKVTSVDGGVAPVAPGSERNSEGESDFDIQLAQSLVYPQMVEVYQVDDTPQAEAEESSFSAGFLNTFLDSIDGSYCNYSAYGITGDSPGIDAQYPDDQPGGYTGQLECGTYQLTRVLSISYGTDELDLPKAYTERQCNEFMKLGLQGHSIFVSSGDYGVAGFPGDEGDEFGCLSGNGQNGTIYNPGYPNGCPYLTVVGGTQLYPNDTVKDPESAMQVNLTAYNIETDDPSEGESPPLDFFASSGGFSNYFPRAAYQASAVKNYLANYVPDLPYYIVNDDATNIGVNGGVYNRAGRAWPDVAANGAFLLSYINLTEFQVFGTSLSSPIFASTINLINEERTAAGKGPVGFVNPVLYENPHVLNDITNGSNPNCGSSGFSAVPGWDPVTGLGTPNYPKMLKLFMSLP